ncbi:MAG TPA: hypothetical protein DIU00_16975 [Phycisphaerales bacterium]|nr:hypothetical protein [Phycisphaerales bacterium]
MSENEPKNEARNKAENINKQTYVAILVAVVFLVVGIGILVLTTHVAQIKGEAILVALLLIPVFIYLAIMGKLKGFTIGPLSASFIESKVEDIKNHAEENVAEIVEYENQRSAYLGKLSQILKKKSRFFLIYADVDDLRQYSRKLFLEDKSSEERSKENEIRKEIIDILDYALADAFCDCKIKDANGKDAKYDIFQLIEPDIVMIARDTDSNQAKLIKQKAEKNFKNYLKEKKFDELDVTISSISKTRDEMKGATPRSLDKEAHEGHNELKKARKIKDT